MASSVAMFLAVLAAGAPSAAEAADACHRYVAPLKVRSTPPLGAAEFLNPKISWGQSGTDSGVIVDGYVGLATARVRHGVDLSSNNEFREENFRNCPPEFVVIRVDARFPDNLHAVRALSPSTGVIPYALLTVPDGSASGRLRTSYYSKFGMSGAAPDAEEAAFSYVGDQQAKALVGKLNQFGVQNFSTIAIGDLKVRFVVLDAENKLQDETSCPVFNAAKPSCVARQLFGQLYAHQICAWSKRLVVESGKALTPMLYTSPSVYSDYLKFASSEDDSCIAGIPVWVARTSTRADDASIVTQRGDDLAIDTRQKRDLCYSPAGNRCLMHQYTHRGQLGTDPMVLAENPSHTKPWHVDLDRLFAAKAVTSTDGAITYIVRADTDQP